MMLCTNKNKDELLDFLFRKPSENCFFIGDIENFNMDEDFIDVWKFESDKKISSILLRYYKFYLISSERTEDMEQIAEIINSDNECVSVSGIEDSIDLLLDHLKFLKIKRTFLAELSSETFVTAQSSLSPQKATVDDINDLFDFQKSIKEFSVDERNRDSFGKEITSGTGKMYYIKQKGKIVSSATITAENSINGTIIGVATDSYHRGKGYAKACMTEICKEMMAEGKKVILFYNNPDAGKLYKKLGFRDVGKWAMGSIR